MPLSLLSFAAAGDAAAATPGKLAKQHTLAALFAPLDDDDLRRAVRYMNGRAFKSSDERVLGVSSRLIADVVLGLLPVSPTDYRAATIRHGEVGEALSELWNQAHPATACESASGEEDNQEEEEEEAPTDDRPSRSARGFAVSPLTLEGLAKAFDALAATTQPLAKKPIIRSLFERAVHPREACYLAKIILNDLRTGIKEGVLQAGVAEAFGVTLQDILKAQLLVGDLAETAVLAKTKQLDQARFTPFHPLQFMLARPVEAAADAPGIWSVEDKLDGIRAQVHKRGADIAIYTRTMDRADGSFPEVVQAVARVPGAFVIDAEIVPIRNGRVLPFGVLQKRLGRKTPTTQHLKDAPCVLVAFDLLWRDDTLLIDEPLTARRAALEDLVGAPTEIVTSSAQSPSPPEAGVRGDASGFKPVLLSAATTVDSIEALDIAFAAARDRGNEGLMLKSPDSKYTPGRRGGAWLKIKTHLPTLDCVVTAAEFGHGKRRGTLSDYTFGVWTTNPADEGSELVNIGKAFSGVTDAEIAQLTELFQSIAVSSDGRVFQVKPQVVMEIAFDQIQESKRHAGGYALRFPRVKRIRWDKKPEDADLLSRVKEVYDSTHNFGRVEKIEPAKEPSLFD